MARPSKYKSHVEPRLDEVEKWAADGDTDETIAKKLGIAASSYYEYKNKYAEFSETLKRGKQIIDDKVENALLKRALGYDYEEVTTEYDEIGQVIKSKTVTKHVAPDVGAQAFWLKNRRPALWRDRQEHGVELSSKESASELSEYLTLLKQQQSKQQQSKQQQSKLD